MFKHKSSEAAQSKSRSRVQAILNNPIKTDEFFAKNPFAKVFYSEHTSAKTVEQKIMLDGKNLKEALTNASGSKPLILEIGCHHGAIIRKWAHIYPQTNFLGMDVTYKRVVRTALGRSGSDPIKNLRSILHNAQDISECFHKNQLAGVCLFFPDPWPKKRQRKHRYVNNQFLGQVREALKVGGFFWFKSDDLSYYKEAFEAAKASGFAFAKRGSLLSEEREFSPLSLICGDRDAHATLFENKFWDQKQTTYQFLCVKTVT